MRKKTQALIILCFLLLGEVAFPQITFQKRIGGSGEDDGASIHQTTDGGYIISGIAMRLTPTNSKVFLIKTNSNGDTLWSKLFGGSGEDYGYAVQQTYDGGYIVSGLTYSFGAGGADVYLIKTDSLGNTLWSKTYGGSYDDGGRSVYQTNDGGFIIAGFTDSFGAGSYDIYLVKTDSAGNTQWTKSYGGFNHEEGFSVIQALDEGFIVVGDENSFSNGSHRVYAIKTDDNGNLLWSKTYGGGSTNSDIGWSVQKTTGGGYIISGFSYSFGSGGYNVAYLLKTDSVGNIDWSKTYGGNGYYSAMNVQQTNDNGYIITGSSGGTGAIYNDDVLLIKTDSIGNLIWSQSFGGTDNDFGVSASQTNDGGYIVTGYTKSFGANFYDVYLIKTDSYGNSGCNQNNFTTVSGNPATITSVPPTVVFSPNTIQNDVATSISSFTSITTLCSTVGISEFSNEASFGISPNPSTGYFILEFEKINFSGNIEIINILGEIVFAKNVSSESKIGITLNNVDGIYFVKIFDGEISCCKKLIIEHD